MASTVPNALLLASLSDLSTPHFLSPVIITAATSAQKRLVIALYSPLFTSPSGDVTDPPISHTERWDDVQRLLTFVYVQATKAAQEVDKVLLEVDVLLKGVNEGIPEFVVETDVVFRVQGGMYANSSAWRPVRLLGEQIYSHRRCRLLYPSIMSLRIPRLSSIISHCHFQRKMCPIHPCTLSPP